MTIDALSLEVKKDGFQQLQSGSYKLTVTLNPADLQDNAESLLLDFIKAPMGQRYMLGMAGIGDDEQPVKTEKPKERTRSQWAGIRCNTLAWREWFGFPDEDAELLAIRLREHLGIQSRKELDSNPAKASAWDKLDAAFIEATRLPERHG